jgi:hypothetical protein
VVLSNSKSLKSHERLRHVTSHQLDLAAYELPQQVRLVCGHRDYWNRVTACGLAVAKSGGVAVAKLVYLQRQLRRGRSL